MGVSQVTSSSPYLKDTVKSPYKAELGKDDFLKLLITQMQYQDPLQPMDNTEYISQMAQLSTLEQMSNISHEFSTLRAYQLIGKNVTAVVDGTITGTIEKVTGKVDKVTIDGSNVSLIVGNKTIGIDDISEVSDDGI